VLAREQADDAVGVAKRVGAQDDGLRVADGHGFGSGGAVSGR